MYSIVKALRKHGRRLPDRSISADPGLKCELTLAKVGVSLYLVAHARTDPQRNPLIPQLMDAHLVTMIGARMLFQGLESEGGPDGPTYLQEWAVEVLPQP